MKKYLVMIVAAMAAIMMDAQLVQVYKGDASSPIFTLADADSVVWSQELPSEADTTAYSGVINLTWTATNYAMQYSTIVRDTTTYYYIGLFDDGYYEQWIQGGGDDNGLNEAIVGWIEASYYYETYEEISPYQIATGYCRKGTISSQFTALAKNTKYEVIAFFYDYNNDVAGDVTYVWHVQTTNEDPKPVYPVEMTIELSWSGTTLSATPSLTTQKYLFDAVSGETASSYTTPDELAQAVLESYKGSIPSYYCNTGKASYDFSYLCYLSSDDDTIVGFAFGVDTDGKICSQPVWAKTVNPYYSSGYDDAPDRQAAAKEQKAAIARIYKEGVAKFVVANADSVVFTSTAVIDPLTFDIDVSEVKDTTSIIEVTPSDTTARYFWLQFDSTMVVAQGSAKAAAEYIMAAYYKAFIDNYNETYETSYTFYDFPSPTYRAYQGVDRYTWSGLKADTQYYVVAFKVSAQCDVIDEPKSPLVVKTYRTGK